MNKNRGAPVGAAEAVYCHTDVFGSSILVRIVASHLGERVLEVGAGAGCITRELAKRGRHIVALEPTSEPHSQLVENVASLTNVVVHQQTLQSFVDEWSRTGWEMPTFDSVVYINVLEHIKDDVTELSLAKSLLAPGGRVVIVVPAHQWLFSKVDRLTGHFRRYSKKSLRDVVLAADLRALDVHYFDSVGLIPYLLIYKWLRSTRTQGANATVYSRLILPLSALLYRWSSGRLIGKNLIAVALQS
jgi:2-polyprenyl-3-methyl-5-hydroxy-6-metoxy-1,4-benzoquinol methylase